MVFVQWNDAYKIGHELIDSQHKRILEKINDIHDYVYGQKDIKVKEHLNFLLEYTQHHLNFEDEFMDKFHYPDLERHKSIHYEFKKKTIELIYKYHQSEFTFDDVTNMLIFLKNWWINHILVVDKNFIPFLNTLSKNNVNYYG